MREDNHPVERKMQGFSLLELMVVIILISGFIVIAIPTINSLTGVEIKSEVTKVAGLMNEVYGRAALTGKTQRIVFDLENQKYWVEESTKELGEISPELGYEDLMKSALERQKEGKEDSEKDRFLPSFKPLTNYLGEGVVLKKGLVIHGAWTEQMEQVARTGTVAIYFFAGGYTQSAFISIAIKDDDNSAFYIALSPLTGAVEINYGEPNISDLQSNARED